MGQAEDLFGVVCSCCVGHLAQVLGFPHKYVPVSPCAVYGRPGQAGRAKQLVCASYRQHAHFFCTHLPTTFEFSVLSCPPYPVLSVLKIA